MRFFRALMKWLGFYPESTPEENLQDPLWPRMLSAELTGFQGPYFPPSITFREDGVEQPQFPIIDKLTGQLVPLSGEFDATRAHEAAARTADESINCVDILTDPRFLVTTDKRLWAGGIIFHSGKDMAILLVPYADQSGRPHRCCAWYFSSPTITPEMCKLADEMTRKMYGWLSD